MATNVNKDVSEKSKVYKEWFQSTMKNRDSCSDKYNYKTAAYDVRMDIELKDIYIQHLTLQNLYKSGDYVNTGVQCQLLEARLDRLDLYKMSDSYRQSLCRALRKKILRQLCILHTLSVEQLKQESQKKMVELE